MVFYRQDRPYRQDCPYRQDRPLTIEVESRGISWNLVESRPVTIEVETRGFLSESASYDDEVSESDDEVEFL